MSFGIGRIRCAGDRDPSLAPRAPYGDSAPAGGELGHQVDRDREASLGARPRAAVHGAVLAGKPLVLISSLARLQAASKRARR